MHRSTPLARAAAPLVALALFAAACGDDDPAVATIDPDAAEMTETSGDLADMGGMTEDAMSEDGMSEDGMAMAMNMGDPDATPAEAVDGADLARGDFVLLDTRSSGHDDVTGAAVIARHDGGTTVTVRFEGLIPGTAYISHLHERDCSEAGGDHFQFEEGGATTPPNEVHLAFTADADGNGFMTAENDRTAGPDAVAVVVHPQDLLDNKIACADLR